MQNVPASLINVSEVPALLLALEHGVTFTTDRTGSVGVTVWSTASKSAVFTWHWQLTPEGDPVLMSPLGVRSNLLFRHDGVVLPADRQLLLFNELVNRLAWQEHVIAITDVILYPRRTPQFGGALVEAARDFIPPLPLAA